MKYIVKQNIDESDLNTLADNLVKDKLCSSVVVTKHNKELGSAETTIDMIPIIDNEELYTLLDKWITIMYT